MDMQCGQISPISPIGQEPLSHMHMFNESRPLESTDISTHYFEASTLVHDKTVVGGLSQDDTIQPSPSLLNR